MKNTSEIEKETKTMIQTNSKKIKQEITTITVTDQKTQEKYIIVGVDLSKSKLDIMHTQYKVYSNDEKGCNRFCKEIKALGSNVVVVYEATGYISLNFAEMLDINGIKRCQISPRRVRHHAKAGIGEAKTDKLDCEAIQTYAINYWSHLAIQEPMHENHAELQELQRVKNMYTQHITKTKQLLSTCSRESSRKSLNDELERLKEAKKAIAAEINELLQKNEDCRRLLALLMQQVGVGIETATALVLNLPELGKVNRRQIASLTGTAPFNYDSGSRIGKRFTRFGRKNIRDLLYMAVRAALNSKVENEYQRRFEHLSKSTNLKGGRAYKQVMVACMRMMIVKLNAITREWLAAGKPDPTKKETEEKASGKHTKKKQ